MDWDNNGIEYEYTDITDFNEIFHMCKAVFPYLIQRQGNIEGKMALAKAIAGIK